MKQITNSQVTLRTNDFKMPTLNLVFGIITMSSLLILPAQMNRNINTEARGNNTLESKDAENNMSMRVSKTVDFKDTDPPSMNKNKTLDFEDSDPLSPKEDIAVDFEVSDQRSLNKDLDLDYDKDLDLEDAKPTIIYVNNTLEIKVAPEPILIRVKRNSRKIRPRITYEEVVWDPSDGKWMPSLLVSSMAAGILLSTSAVNCYFLYHEWRSAK